MKTIETGSLVVSTSIASSGVMFTYLSLNLARSFISAYSASLLPGWTFAFNSSCFLWRASSISFYFFAANYLFCWDALLNPLFNFFDSFDRIDSISLSSSSSSWPVLLPPCSGLAPYAAWFYYSDYWAWANNQVNRLYGAEPYSG